MRKIPKIYSSIVVVPGYAWYYRCFLFILIFFGVLSLLATVVFDDIFFRSRLFVSNRFMFGSKFQEIQSVCGMSVSDQSCIGWDSDGKSYVLVGYEHVIANHNNLPKTLFFRTLCGDVVSRKLELLPPLLSEPSGRPLLRLAKLSSPLLPTDVKLIPIWKGHIEFTPGDTCIFFASGGDVGFQNQAIVQLLNFSATHCIPVVVSSTYPRKWGQIYLKSGDSGGPLIAKVGEKFYIYALAYGSISNSFLGFGESSCQNIFIPLSPYSKSLNYYLESHDTFFLKANCYKY